MAIASVLTNTFKTELLKGLHSFDTSGATPAGSVFKIALYNSSADLGTTTTAYTTTEELATATGYTRPGNTLTNIDVTLDSDTAVCDFSNTSWTSATFTARGLLLYNTTAITGFTTNRSILAINFGGDKTVTSGTFTIEFPAAAASTAIIQIA